MHLPPRLRPGDTIGIVTPSRPITASPSLDPSGDLERGMEFLRGLGFKAVLGEHALHAEGYSAGSPQQRAADINTLNTFLPIGVRARLDAAHARLEIVEPCVG
jgi:muramoyltetrapeptide carboxypeptidase